MSKENMFKLSELSGWLIGASEQLIGSEEPFNKIGIDMAKLGIKLFDELCCFWKEQQEAEEVISDKWKIAGPDAGKVSWGITKLFGDKPSVKVAVSPLRYEENNIEEIAKHIVKSLNQMESKHDTHNSRKGPDITGNPPGDMEPKDKNLPVKE